MAQLMPLPFTVSCFSEIQIGFTFLVPAHLGSPGKGPLNGCKRVLAGVNEFTDFSEIVPTSEITTKMDKTFLFLVRGRGPIFEWVQCCSINSTHINPALSSTEQ